MWTGTHFQKSSLQEIGQKIQLGHNHGIHVQALNKAPVFSVIHKNGIHLVDISFCGCDHAAQYGDRVQQLLRYRLLPATTTDPQTASTFALLKSVHVLSIQSKLSLYDFYQSNEILTDATHISDVKVRVAFIDSSALFISDIC